MLTVFLTGLFALYVLGPDLLFRWVVGWYATARYRKRSYGEQITSACLLCLIPDLLIWEVVRHLEDAYSPAHKALFKALADGALSADFDKHSQNFYPAFAFFCRLNIWCVIGVYLLVTLVGVWFGHLLRSYGKLLRKYEDSPKRRGLVTALVRPWTAEWHLRLSSMLLPSKTTYIQLDVLTNMDVLYRGTLVEHHLANDGNLVSVTLEETRKFKRKELLTDREKFETSAVVARKARRKGPDPEDYWSDVGGRFFVIRADEVVSLNIRYVEKAKPQFTKEVVQEILDHLQTLRRSPDTVARPPLAFDIAADAQGSPTSGARRTTFTNTRNPSTRKMPPGRSRSPKN